MARCAFPVSGLSCIPFIRSQVRNVQGIVAVLALSGCGSASSTGVPAGPGGSPVPTPPGAPTSLTAVDGDGEVQLDWVTPAGATSFRVLRASTADGTYELRGAPDSVNFTDAAPNGVVSYYAVQAV